MFACIEAAVDVDPMISHQSVDAQLAKFIVKPLRHFRSTEFNSKDSPFVIITDRLDEYQGDNLQSGLMKLLVAALHHFPLRIRILIASRPEVCLQSTFNSSSIPLPLTRLALSAEEDIY